MPGSSLTEQFVVIDPQQHASTVTVTADLYNRLDRDYGGFAGHQLVSVYDFSADWDSWERHPHGDEVVVLLSGEAEFILDTAEGQQVVALIQPGEALIVPGGCGTPPGSRRRPGCCS